MTVAIRNALSAADAEEMRNIFDSAGWTHMPHNESHYYSRTYKDPGVGIPDASEVYTTDFYRSSEVAHNKQILPILSRLIDVVDANLTGAKVIRNGVDILPYRLRVGGHLRLHNDEYAADLGFIWYLSREWKWDWGGLLVEAHEDGTGSVELPEFNKLVIIDHSKAVSHCVTSVEKWARDDRVFMVGMMKLENIND